MDDGYLIYLTIHWENANLGIDSFDPATLHLLDANGEEIPYDVDFEATDSAQATVGPGQTILAIKTASLQNAGSLTFTIDSVCASMSSNSNFIFDPGPDPQPGQVWDLNQNIDIGNGHSLQVLRVRYDLTDGTQALLSFDISSDTGVTYATLLDQAHPPQGGGGGGATCSPGPFTAILYYSEPLPKEPITLTIVGISVNLPGPWEAVWTPPAPQNVSTTQP
jgi:hypothetical protein